MGLKWRTDDKDKLVPDGGPSDQPGCDGLAEARKRGEELIAAGSAAIERVLSGDSQTFLQARRQSGGQ